MKTIALFLLAATLCAGDAPKPDTHTLSSGSVKVPLNIDSRLRNANGEPCAFVTKAEVEEVVKALQILMPTQEMSGMLRARAAEAEQREKDLEWAKSVLTKWQAKLEAMK